AARRSSPAKTRCFCDTCEIKRDIGSASWSIVGCKSPRSQDYRIDWVLGVANTAKLDVFSGQSEPAIPVRSRMTAPRGKNRVKRWRQHPPDGGSSLHPLLQVRRQIPAHPVEVARVEAARGERLHPLVDRPEIRPLRLDHAQDPRPPAHGLEQVALPGVALHG